MLELGEGLREERLRERRGEGEEEEEAREEEEEVEEESLGGVATAILGTLLELPSEEGRAEEEEGEESSEIPLPFAEGGGGGASASSSPSRDPMPLRLRSIPNFILSSSNFRVAGFFNPPPSFSFSFCAAFCVRAISFC